MNAYGMRALRYAGRRRSGSTRSSYTAYAFVMRANMCGRRVCEIDAVGRVGQVR